MKLSSITLALLLGLIVLAGCDRKAETGQFPQIAPPKTSKAPTEEGVLAAVRLAAQNQLPAHFVVRRAPAETVSDGPQGPKLRIRAEIEAVQASYISLGQINNESGKHFTLAKRVYTEGEKFEVTFVADTVMTVDGPGIVPPAFGKDIKDYGMPLTQLTNAFDVESETGKRLQAAPSEIQKAQRWLDEQAGRKRRFERLKTVYDEKGSPADAYNEVIALYPETRTDMEAAAPLPFPRSEPYHDRVRKFLGERFSTDYATFMQRVAAAQSIVASETRFLNEL